MKKPSVPKDEKKRLKSLRSLGILDTPPEERFDRIVRMAARMFDLPIAYISLIDNKRQWFKASIGIEFSEISREQSICAHAIPDDEAFVIADAATDHRFADGPLVMGDTGFRFYAGCPIKLANGSTIGTLCVADHHPRIMDDGDLALLRDLAAMVEREIGIMQLAITDDLTGIYNRKGFILAAQHSLNLCVRQDLPATLAYLDLSEFNSINENYGQVEGDRVLTDISRHLTSECRPSDIFARLGTDQFVALFINAPKNSAEGIMTRFQRLLNESNAGRASGSDLNFAYGIVEYDFKRHKMVESLLDDGAACMLQTTQRKAS